MGVKKVLEPYQLFTNAVMSGTTTLTSQVINIKYLDNIAIQWEWSGTPVGTFSVNGSVSGINYIPITFPDPLPIPNGNASNWMSFLTLLGLQFITVSYTNSSGSGLLNVWIAGKDVN